MLIIPYRVKNPWKKFPVATVTLIGLNVLIYLLTTHYGLIIRDEVVRAFAYEYGKSPLFNILASMFLHGDIMHLVGNMLFLWVFAPTVEERLGIPAFLLVYFTAGVMGDVLQGVTEMLAFGTHPVMARWGSPASSRERARRSKCPGSYRSWVAGIRNR